MLLIFATMFSLVSCFKEKDEDETVAKVYVSSEKVTKKKDKETDSPAFTTTAAMSEETMEPNDPNAPLPSLPVVDMDGRELRMLFPEPHAAGHYLNNELAVEGTATNNIEEAVVLRNLAVEAAYNVSITSSTAFVSDVSQTIRNEGFMGASTYAAIAAPIANSKLNAIVQEGYLADFNKMAYYYEDGQPWWNHDLMDDLSIANARFFASGDIIYSDDFYPYCVYVNNAVSQAQGITDDYFELVRNYEWTLEKFHELAASVASEYDYTGDGMDAMHGAIINANFYRTAYYSAGKGLIAMDSKGYPQWVMTKQYATDILDKVNAIVHDDSACTFADKISDDHVTNEKKLFANNKSLFLVEELIFSERITRYETDVDFKVLPFPLYDENSEYRTVLNDALVLAVPTTAENKDDISLILSAMSRESVSTLTPVFFETVLTYRYMRDIGSGEMLQIVLDSVVAPDIATVQNWGNMMKGFKELGYENSNAFASVYDANFETAMAKLEDYCVLLDDYYR